MSERLVREFRFTPFGTSMAPDRWQPADGLTPRGKVTLGVHFLAATRDERAACERAVGEWLKDGVESYLDFRLGVRVEDAQIRVHFGPGRDVPDDGWPGGNWSHIGRRASFEQPNRRKPTMNIQPGQPDFVVKHEFGHALGLRHEHQHPDGAITWKDEVVIAAMGAAPHHWTVEETRRNILIPLNSAARCVGDPDPNFESVMMYDYPATWNREEREGRMGRVISARDRLCVRGLYSL
ncbi:MAG: hypothetical protein K2X46_16715 [Roseomonas sp.]|nr:hypothetical protein [Roseomonas sp.]